jgi:ubiquinone/menaquinone biosynthesis C-methylase UbiE
MRNWLYHILIHAVTTEYYRNCLGYVPPGSRILDVGIGNGLMIERFHWLIRAKRLRITGIDIDRQYLVHCRRLIRKYRLDDCIDVHEGAAERYEPVQEDRFDFVLFSMSFMLLSENDLAVHEDRVVGREPFHGQCRVIIASAGSPDRDICAASAGAPLVISQSA